MGKLSRNKGKRGELELVHLFRNYGFEAAARNPDQSYESTEEMRSVGIDVKTDVRGIDGLHVQSKFSQTLALPAWIKQAEGDCPDDSIPVVCYRKAYPAFPHKWRLDADLEDVLPWLVAFKAVLNQNRAPV